jgi:hypothetical protein
MPETNVVYKQIESALAQKYTDPLFEPTYNVAFPAIEVPFSIGKARKKGERPYREQAEGFSDKFSIARSNNTTDELTDYQTDWESDAFEFSKSDLGEYAIRGFNSQRQMIDEEREIMSTRFRKKKQLALWNYVNTDTNFAGATYRVAAGVAWSNWGTSSPGDDVWAGLQHGKRYNAIHMGLEDYYNCLANQTINKSAQAAGMDKGALNPSIGIEYLKRYFRVQYIFVAGGEYITDSADRSATATTDLWGNKVLLFYHTPQPKTSSDTWMKHIFFRPGDPKMGETSEGWRIIETTTKEEGGIGIYKEALWNNYKYLQQNTKLGYRIDGTH